MMTLLRILFGLGAYVLLAYSIGRNLRAMSRHYPPAPCTAGATVKARAATVAMPVTLPHRVPGILVHAMNS